eukprot:CAMPEP_0194751436 /NCGR_PEP_ID=MMETSP0323_2-20130528/5497_1 /TAXON_ID=2866 ORGANISM="Crypthecodinium cohnii, Strain Seligo" /NCGR_SAMPLE_ID=MMETSP0323_2 /ASSEMBLY_ACC=CAM_ASM_000346 /LENGTH=85 /DNA_ID=CAMNT_0039667937 /DNA_START=146 /DNA_END=403 /DNA_ORIENTATION=+
MKPNPVWGGGGSRGKCAAPRNTTFEASPTSTTMARPCSGANYTLCIYNVPALSSCKKGLETGGHDLECSRSHAERAHAARAQTQN